MSMRFSTTSQIDMEMGWQKYAIELQFKGGTYLYLKNLYQISKHILVPASFS